MATTTIDLRALITQEANSQGVPAAIALAVASRESGIAQWTANGSLVMGAAGEIGVFQLEPPTAAALGVDPTDVYQNIHGGVSYLKQMYNQFGNWTLALEAYNWGPGNLMNAIATGGSVPSSVQTYATSIIGSSSDGSIDAGTDPSLLPAAPAFTIAGIPLTAASLAIGGGLLFLLWLDW